MVPALHAPRDLPAFEEPPAVKESILRLLHHKQTRAFAAVLFRRIATKTRKDPATGEAKEVFLTLPNEQRVAIREKLVTCLTTESVTDVRKKIGDAVAEVARQYTDNGMPPRNKYRNWC